MILHIKQHSYGAGVWLFTSMFLYGTNSIIKFTSPCPIALHESMEDNLSDHVYRLAVFLGSANENATKYHAHMKALLKGCKYICRVDITGEPSLFFDHIRKKCRL